MSRAGTRWYLIHCAHCGIEHGFTAGALVVLIGKAQNGEVTTVKGNSVCLLVPLADHVPHSTDPNFAFVERAYGG